MSSQNAHQNGRSASTRAMGRLINGCLKHVGIEVHRKQVETVARPDAEVVTKVGKFSILMRSDNPLHYEYSVHPEYSMELGRLAQMLAQKYPSMMAIDVGANVGDTTAIVRSHVNIPVTCVEGDDLCYPLLERNARQFPGVTCHHRFLGEHTGTVAVSAEKKGWNTTLIPSAKAAKDSFAVELTRLDDLLSGSPDLSRYKLLKIDAEGFDTKILRGAPALLRDVKPVVYFEYNRENMSKIAEDGLSTLHTLADIGYQHAIFFDNSGRFLTATELSNQALIKDLHDYADGVAGRILYYDIALFHKNDEDVALRFAESEREIRLKGLPATAL